MQGWVSAQVAQLGLTEQELSSAAGMGGTGLSRAAEGS